MRPYVFSKWLDRLLGTGLLLILLAYLLSSCAGPRGYVASGEALAAIGQQFVQTGHLYDTLLEKKLITPEQYRPWAAFAKEFQWSYPKAVEMWRLAVRSEDAAAAGKLEEVVLALKNQLLTFALEAAERLRPAGGKP